MTIPAPSISRLSGALSEAASGRPLADDEAWALVDADASALAAMCDAAGSMRDLGKGRTVSFSPKVFIPLTHMCRDFCGYCIFRKTPQQAGNTLYMTPEQVLEVTRAGQVRGCTEALFTLGERPELRYAEAKDWLATRGFGTTLEYLGHVNRLVLEETMLLPHDNPGTMSRREMAALLPYNPSMGLMLKHLARAARAGRCPRVRAQQEAAGQAPHHRAGRRVAPAIYYWYSRWNRRH